MKVKNVHQVMPSLSYGDAVSNEALFLKQELKKMGFESHIYAEDIHPKLHKEASYFNTYRRGHYQDILIHHFAIGSSLNEAVFRLKGVRKVMRYHNITPKHFFKGYNYQTYNLCKQGRKQLAAGKDCYDLALGDSEYNRKELEELGYQNTSVMSFAFNPREYEKEPCKKTIKRYKDGKVNLLFVGRISPNKKQEDVILAFYIYKKYVNPESRLFLVGSYFGMEKYYMEILELVNHLQLEDVFITGHVIHEEIIAYYHVADVFICMSEHEGFCVPLLESMYFKVPVIAYDSSAVGETLGPSGVLFYQKDFPMISEMIDIIAKNQKLKEKLIFAQEKRLEYFSQEITINTFRQHIYKLVG